MDNIESVCTFMGVDKEEIEKKAQEMGIELNESTIFEVVDRILCEKQKAESYETKILNEAIESLETNTTKGTLHCLWLIAFQLPKNFGYCGAKGVAKRLLYKHEAYEEDETIEKCVAFLKSLKEEL